MNKASMIKQGEHDYSNSHSNEIRSELNQLSN